jgi:YidC/Oxa1 family membrane protein insertase
LDDRRLILFFAISLAILVLWQLLVPSAPPSPPAGPGAVEEPVLPPPPAFPPGTPSPQVEAAEELPELPPVAAVAEERVVVETAEYRAELTNRGAQLLSFVLREHRDGEGRPLELVRRRAAPPWPLALLGEDLEPLPLNDALFTVQRRQEEGATVVAFEHRGPQGVARKELRFLANGLVAVEVEVKGQSGWGLLLGPGIRNPASAELAGRTAAHTAVYLAAGDLESVRPGKVNEARRLPGAGIAWAGLEDTYFLSVLVPGAPLQSLTLQPVTVAPGPEGEPLSHVPFLREEELGVEQRALARDLMVILQPTGEALRGHLFLGPKEHERLRAFELGLERSVDWGWLGFLVRPLLIGLRWIHENLVANYGWAIVLMTIVLKILLFPLTHKSIISMQKMQVLQPKIQAIRQKYKGKLRDKRGRMDLEQQRKMNEEMQELFRSEGASPTGGCLPLLLQIPFFFAFFRLLLTAVELRHEPWVLWVHDVSAPDPWYVLPVVMGLTQVYQQRLTPMSGDPMQRRIMQFFPWMFMIFAFSFPSGVVLYWTVNNVLTIFQTKAYKARDRRREALAAARPARREEEKGAESNQEQRAAGAEERAPRRRRGGDKGARKGKR